MVNNHIHVGAPDSHCVDKSAPTIWLITQQKAPYWCKITKQQAYSVQQRLSAMLFGLKILQYPYGITFAQY